MIQEGHDPILSLCSLPSGPKNYGLPPAYQPSPPKPGLLAVLASLGLWLHLCCCFTSAFFSCLPLPLPLPPDLRGFSFLQSPRQATTSTPPPNSTTPVSLSYRAVDWKPHDWFLQIIYPLTMSTCIYCILVTLTPTVTSSLILIPLPLDHFSSQCVPLPYFHAFLNDLWRFIRASCMSVSGRVISKTMGNIPYFHCQRK